MDYRTTSIVLAALRIAQEEGAERINAMDHMVDVKPVTVEEIDDICAQINHGGV